MTNTRRRRFAVALGLALLGSTWSCVGGRTAPERTVGSLLVRNRGDFDVNVFALPSPVGRPYRLGTVTVSSSVRFALKAWQLQPGGRLVVRLHAIGSRGYWTSDAVTVTNDLSAVLDVTTDPSGDCSRSSFYTVATDTI